jgi:hypothetical protein
MNAPVFGGFFGLRLRGSDVDDRRRDVLAIEDVPLFRLGLAALLIFLLQVLEGRTGRLPCRQASRWARSPERCCGVGGHGQRAPPLPDRSPPLVAAFRLPQETIGARIGRRSGGMLPC